TVQEQIRQKYNLPAIYALFVGTIEPRKNLVSLLKAFRITRERHPNLKLVLAGKKGWLYEEVFQTLHKLGLESEVIRLGFVPDEDLPALYSAARYFVYPSLYEGFGLPVLEALACGTPVICSDRSSLPEVAGDAAILVAPDEIGALVQAMERVLIDSTLRQAMRERGIEQARRFSWERAAKETLALYGNTDDDKGAICR
ncbi:MAG: glycosyltransferase family 4 protein, partial [Chloroflexota bacterium]|nr:glycosyltransferase family 4 protein [Chloroflexota bacterium]